MSKSTKLKSFVIFDSETTGLPSPGNKPRITELSFIAVSREELRSKQRDQRVLNKLHLCVNPCKQIHHRSSELTGLHNDSLSFQATFSKQADLVVSFMRNLPQPTCLLAHNGHRFDFPLLKAELKRSQKSLSENVHCADTLEAFRIFDGLPPVPAHVLESERQKKKLLAAKVAKQLTVPSSYSSSSIDRPAEENANSTEHEKGGEASQSSKKRRSDCLITSGEQTETAKEMRLLEEPSNQHQHETERTPEKKTSSPPSFQDDHHHYHSSSHNHTTYKDDESQNQNRISNGSNRVQLDSVRKRLFKSPKLSLKSDSNLIDDRVGQQIQNETQRCSIDSGSVCFKGQTDGSSIADEDPDATLCYSVPDSSSSELSQSESSKRLSHHNSNSINVLTDSDKGFLEAYEEVDKLFSRPTPTFTDNKVICESKKHQHYEAAPTIPCSMVSKSSSSPPPSSSSAAAPPPSSSSLATPPPPSSSATTTTPSTSPDSARKSYGLGNLYQFHFGQRPTAVHTAEDDCKTLLKLISLNVDRLVSYCDQNAILFSDIEPMY